VAQARGFATVTRQSQRGVLQWQNVHISLMITYKLLSSQHKRKVNDVTISFFLTTPRSHGPSQERRRSHIISSWYLTKKLLGPKTRIPQNTFGGLRSPLGSYPQRYTTKDQSKHQAKILWNTSRSPRTHLRTYINKSLGPCPRTPAIHWGPSLGSFAMALTAWSQTKNPRSVLGALDLS
jgi:hypothetical protein